MPRADVISMSNRIVVLQRRLGHDDSVRTCIAFTPQFYWHLMASFIHRNLCVEPKYFIVDAV
jgi:hypothetical protein